MEFNRDKHRVQHLGRSNCVHCSSSEAVPLEMISVAGDLGVVVSNGDHEPAAWLLWPRKAAVH